jgi:hypothetical protein
MRREYNGLHKRGREEKEWKEEGAEDVNKYRRKRMDLAGILKRHHVFLLSLKSAPPPLPQHFFRTFLYVFYSTLLLI